VIFTQGCNFSCPYCHNPDLVPARGETLAGTDILSFLEKRKPILDGVVISGGEPTIHQDLPEFLLEIKHLGYLIKLDTNGSNYQMVEKLISNALIDYVALDLKTVPSDYPGKLSLSSQDPTQSILQTISILRNSQVHSEFRTTCVHPFITNRSILALAQLAQGHIPWYLQLYHPGKILQPQFMAKYPDQPGEPELLTFKEIAREYLPCHLR
jgi:pyruvate formate lyase activating enzyme